MRKLRTHLRLVTLLTLVASLAFVLPTEAALAAQPTMAAMAATHPQCHSCRAYCASVASAQVQAPLPNVAKVPPFAAIFASALFVVVPTPTDAYWPAPPQIVHPPTIPAYLRHCSFLK